LKGKKFYYRTELKLVTENPTRSVKEALNCALEAQQGWSSGGEDSDGGKPETPIPPISLDRKQNCEGSPTKIAEKLKRKSEMDSAEMW
jgi:hypothetical protein